MSSSEAYLDGSVRLNQLIALYFYPNYIYGINLKITRTIERNVLKGSYTFAPGTIITIREPLTMGVGVSIVRGLTNTMLREYIENMVKHSNKNIFKQNFEFFVSG